ncbi:cyclic amp response element-binding protein a [Anaeramoeba flamelloides]|uniref:Cyclic amp response element-binding protein a n=1 Tax=Anaeramoeba flamelloides TaxID=1746091 RepID=A0AAV8AAK4_9EUKA|nr:cyclic amp response element-binding protein a [Anaeramoeba flamelloides]
MNPHNKKTKYKNELKDIFYLGIWLEKNTHLEYNFKKVEKSLETLNQLFQQNKLNNGVKITSFKALILSQLYYSLEIFDLKQNDFERIDTKPIKKATKNYRTKQKEYMDTLEGRVEELENENTGFRIKESTLKSEIKTLSEQLDYFQGFMNKMMSLVYKNVSSSKMPENYIPNLDFPLEEKEYN